MNAQNNSRSSQPTWLPHENTQRLTLGHLPPDVPLLPPVGAPARHPKGLPPRPSARRIPLNQVTQRQAPQSPEAQAPSQSMTVLRLESYFAPDQYFDR